MLSPGFFRNRFNRALISDFLRKYPERLLLDSWQGYILRIWRLYIQYEEEEILIAIFHLLAGDHDEAFDRLEQAIRTKKPKGQIIAFLAKKLLESS